MFIDLKLLEKYGACSRGKNDFEKEFPKGADSEEVFAALDLEGEVGYIVSYKLWLRRAVYTEKCILDLNIKGKTTLRVKSWDKLVLEFGFDAFGDVRNRVTSECLFYTWRDVCGNIFTVSDKDEDDADVSLNDPRHIRVFRSYTRTGLVYNFGNNILPGFYSIIIFPWMLERVDKSNERSS